MLSIFSHLIFGSPKLLGFRPDGKSGLDSWRDRSIRFDLKRADLELAEAEQLIACFFPMEDVKGNLGELGCLKLTNLRLIWRCCGKKRVNLSIGWRTVSLVFEQTLKDPVGEPVSSICVLTRYESTKYEFIFNKMPAHSESVANQLNHNFLEGLKRTLADKTLELTHLTPMYLADPFESVLKTLQCYKSTWLFRHCQANMARLVTGAGGDEDDQPNRMPSRQFEIDKLSWLVGEQMIDLFPGVCQVESRASRHLGTMILSNIRLIWIDDNLPVRNLSIPYLRINSIKVKSPDRVVISTCDYLATSNQIELRATKPSSTPNQPKSMCDQLQKLCNLYKSSPRYGPESCDDCQSLMCLLKPVELYFDSPSSTELSEGLPMPERPSGGWTEASAGMLQPIKNAGATHIDDSQVDHNEEELGAYNCKLNRYLDEMPAHSRRGEQLELVSAFGLAFEKPANGVELSRLWNLEIS